MEEMGIDPYKLKAGDIIACMHTIARPLSAPGEREVLRVIITKVGKTVVEGVILLCCKETWGHENVGETWRMAPAHCDGSIWRMV